MQLRKLFFTLSFALCSIVIFGQTDVKTSATSYVNAFVEQDFEKMFFLTHPNIVSMGGGKKYVLEDIKRERTSLAKMNFDFTEGSVGEPGEIIEAEGELQVIIPINFKVEIENETYNSDSYLLGASSDDGETWRFVNLDQYDRESLKMFIPNLSDDIKLPVKEGFTKIEN